MGVPEVVYLCREVHGDRLVYVSGADGQPERLYVGVLGEVLREVRVFDFARLRDGGSTHVFTAEGTFFAPTPLVDGPCRWPTNDSSETVCGWPTPDAWRVSTLIVAEALFDRVDVGDYVVNDDGNGRVVVRVSG